MLIIISVFPRPHRRKRSLKHHPDKAGANFDAAKWELFERARDVLSDPAARDAYDSQRSAALVREEQRRTMDAKRRAMVEDLEARERGAVKRPRGGGEGPTMTEAERRRLAEAGRRRLEERQRLMREAEGRERLREREREAERADEETRQKVEPSSPEAKEGRRNIPDASSAADSKMDIDPEPPARNGDGYDDQIANLERRLQEARERKAAKKGKKAARKGGDKHGAHEATIPAPAISEELKADEKKEETTASSSSPAKSFSFSPAAGGKPRVKGDFSSTMARLRAAQAEKEARKRAEEVAAAATATATDGVSS